MTDPEPEPGLTVAQEMYMALCHATDLLDHILTDEDLTEETQDLIACVVSNADYAMAQADFDPVFALPSGERREGMN